MRDKVILDPYGRAMDLVFSPEARERLYTMAEIVWGRDQKMPEEEIAACQDDITAMIVGYWHHGDVARFPRLRAILEVGGGPPSPNALNYEYCFSHGIRVLSCAPAFGPQVAEMGLGLALASARRIATTDAAFRTGTENWSHARFGDEFSLFDKPVGFIGFGGLARALKPLLEPFRGPIRVYDPWLTDAYLRLAGVEPIDLDTLLSTSRLIFVLAAPTPANKALLDADKLALIREDAVLILLSRAHLVDFDALTELLQAGRFRAGIDVFPEEPLPADHPIRHVSNAVLSSHRAGANLEALRNIGTLVVNNLEAILRGLVPTQMQIVQPEFFALSRKDAPGASGNG